MATGRDHMRFINVTRAQTHPPDSGEGNLIPRNAVVFMFSDIFYLIQMQNFVIVGSNVMDQSLMLSERWQLRKLLYSGNELNYSFDCVRYIGELFMNGGEKREKRVIGAVVRRL